MTDLNSRLKKSDHWFPLAWNTTETWKFGSQRQIIYALLMWLLVLITVHFLSQNEELHKDFTKVFISRLSYLTLAVYNDDADGDNDGGCVSDEKNI